MMELTKTSIRFAAVGSALALLAACSTASEQESGAMSTGASQTDSAAAAERAAEAAEQAAASAERSAAAAEAAAERADRMFQAQQRK